METSEKERELVSPAGGADRRNFLMKVLAGTVGFIVTAVPVVLGGLFFFDPLRRKRTVPDAQQPKRDERGFIRVTTTESIPADGTPQKFTVIADQLDAWNYFAEERLGNVILRKLSEGPIETATDVVAFNDVCPHLGCNVEYRPSAPDERAFLCPCHNSAFSLTGERSNQVPPRDLDKLAVEIRNGNEVWVQYQKFRSGTPDKVAIS